MASNAAAMAAAGVSAAARAGAAAVRPSRIEALPETSTGSSITVGREAKGAPSVAMAIVAGAVVCDVGGVAGSAAFARDPGANPSIATRPSATTDRAAAVPAQIALALRLRRFRGALARWRG